MMGTLAISGIARIWRVASKPSTFGIARSIKITDGRRDRARATPSQPSIATATSYPSRPRIIAYRSRLSSVSSTIKMSGNADRAWVSRHELQYGRESSFRCSLLAPRSTARQGCHSGAGAQRGGEPQGKRCRDTLMHEVQGFAATVPCWTSVRPRRISDLQDACVRRTHPL